MEVRIYACKRCGLLYERRVPDTQKKKTLCSAILQREAVRRYAATERGRETGIARGLKRTALRPSTIKTSITCESCGVEVSGKFRSSKRLCDSCLHERSLNSIAKYHSSSKGQQTRSEYIDRSAPMIRKQKQGYYLANIDKVKASKARYRSANKDKIKATDDVWKANNKERVAAYWKARRAAKLGAAGHHTGEQMSMVVWEQGYRCACCGIDISRKYESDHFYPLQPKPGFSQGTNNIENMVALCPTCNRSKSNKDPSQLKLDSWAMTPTGETRDEYEKIVDAVA